MGIENVLLTQSLVPNAFWIMQDFEDFGTFKTSIAKESINVPVTDRPGKPFYMADQQRSQAISTIKFLTKHMSKTIFNSVPYLLGQRKRSFKKGLFKIDQARRVKQIKNSLNYDEPKKDEKYIYFPLHLQPEMTTDTIGHEYCDQLLAIEELIRKIPDDVFIYVKENPKQSGQMREDSFYKRMKTFPRVKYLKRDVNSFELIKGAVAVATITGTAGWEALQMQKPVITFGSAWYRALSGVYEWDSKFDFGQIETFSFDRDKFNTSVNWLGQFLRKGIVDDPYIELVPDYDGKQNAQVVAAAVKEFVSERNNHSAIVHLHSTA